MTGYVVGVDIGTSSSKGVLVDLAGRVLHSATREHQVERPRPGFVEMDATIWWREFVEISAELLAGTINVSPTDIVSVGVSGMGPCVLLTDESMTPLRNAILYGVDMRAVDQIERLNNELGAEAILQRGGSALSTQAAGPKIAWLHDHEPKMFAAARRLLMPSSWLVWNLTGEYVLDHHSASQCTPLYDTDAMQWYEPWARHIAPEIVLPRLLWAGEVAGTVTAAAAEATGLPVGIPVIAGTVDAWSEAISIDGHNAGDLMLMYGTTMFLINTVPDRLTSPVLWGTVGAIEGTRNLAAGMATSGAITSWLRDLFGGPDYPTLLRMAAESGVGARGLLTLPYFAGERTPIADPDARGLIAGLTVTHTQGDLYRAALETTAFGVRHNIEAFVEAGSIDRIVAIGGGTQGDLWTQIVTDVTGREQVIPEQTVGASFGAAYLAAGAVAEVSIHAWNPVRETQLPDPAKHAAYSELYRLYLDLYPETRDTVHALVRQQLQQSSTSPTSTSPTSTAEGTTR